MVGTVGNPKRIAVTGATGFIGSALTVVLASSGHDVIRIGRGRVHPGAVDLSWDPLRGVLDAGALRGVDAVIHLAGAPIIKRWTASRRKTVRRSRVDGTRLLSKSLAQLDHPPRVLLSGSAVGVYGSRGDETLDERSSPGNDFLAETAVAWEDATAEAHAAGIRVVHLRTGIVLGRDGGALAAQVPLFRIGLGGVLGNGRQWMSPISLTDHLRAMFFCLENEALSGPVNLVAPEPVTNSDYTRVLGRILRRPTRARAPALMLRLALGKEMADLTVLASQRVLPTVLANAGFEWNAPTLEHILLHELK